MFIEVLIIAEMCQIAYRRKHEGRSRPIPRLITYRADAHSRTNWTSNDTGQSAISRTKQRTADHNNLISIDTQQTEHSAKFA